MRLGELAYNTAHAGTTRHRGDGAIGIQDEEAGGSGARYRATVVDAIDRDWEVAAEQVIRRRDRDGREVPG
jgi:hypothetical protein